MIIITGSGRSGTSFVARLYKELGFDPGGEWYPHSDSGLEELELVRLNELILQELGLRFALRTRPRACPYDRRARTSFPSRSR